MRRQRIFPGKKAITETLDAHALPIADLTLLCRAGETRERAAHPVEKRLEEARQCDDVLAGDGEQSGQHFVRMLSSVGIEAGGIPFDQRAGFRRQLFFVFPLHARANAEQLKEISDSRLGLVLGDHVRPADLPETRLNGGEIILGMGVCEAERRIRVASPQDIGHAKTVAADRHVVRLGCGDGGGSVETALLQRNDPYTEQIEGERDDGERRRHDERPAAQDG